MEQDQQQAGARVPSDGSDLTPAEKVAALEKMGVVVPTAEWDQIPSLRLIAPSGEPFEKVQQHVRDNHKNLKAKLDGRPGELDQAIHQVAAPLRHLLQASGSGAAGEAAGSAYTSDQARMIFLWGTTWTLEALGDALQKAAAGSEVYDQLKLGVQNTLNDTLRALNESTVQPLVLCSSCYTTYKTCMAAPNANPTVCQSNYTYCSTHCS